MSSWEAKRICPQLIIIPADYDRYIFTSKRIFSLLERLSPTIDVFSIDEAFASLDPDTSWEEASKLALQFKQLIYQHIGSWVTCSVGISYGKTLAKLASEMQKPNGLTLIRPEDFATIAAVTPIEKLCGIGWRLGPRLNQMGVTTIAELGQVPLTMLTQAFGNFTGTWLHNIGNGVDQNILRSFRSLPQEKSVGHSYTLPRDIHSLEDAKKTLLLLSERVGVRLRRKGLIGRTISVYLRFHDRGGWGKSESQQEYLHDGLDIYKVGARLLENIGSSFAPIRLVAVTVSDLAQAVEITKPLFAQAQRYEQLVGSLDTINDRYGEFTVFRGTLATIKQRIRNLPDGSSTNSESPRGHSRGGRNKRIYIPHISETNPFTKRIP